MSADQEAEIRRLHQQLEAEKLEVDRFVGAAVTRIEELEAIEAERDRYERSHAALEQVVHGTGPIAKRLDAARAALALYEERG